MPNQTICPAEFLRTRPFVIMGIVNVTPDSFFDGGVYATARAAIDHALKCIDEGADILDIGGESTRPRSRPVSADEELDRVIPVVTALAQQGRAIISVDTTKAVVAQAALDAGAHWINDISAGRFDSHLAACVARAQCGVVLMHSRGTPATMQENPFYTDVVAEVKHELGIAVDNFLCAGVKPENIAVDPGIGFAKRLEDNLTILQRMQDICALGYPVLVGTSRKSFVGAITKRDAPDRLSGTLGSVAAAYCGGARIFRVHDVKETRDFLEVLVKTIPENR